MPHPSGWRWPSGRNTGFAVLCGRSRGTLTGAAPTAIPAGWRRPPGTRPSRWPPTTLLVSPYQDHDGICRAAEALAARYGTAFLYRDFRVGFRQGQAKARELGLYMQKYCGCVFSEEERYAKQIQRDRQRFGGSGQEEAVR